MGRAVIGHWSFVIGHWEGGFVEWCGMIAWGDGILECRNDGIIAFHALIIKEKEARNPWPQPSPP
jgi:hypothetical protein